MPLFYQHNINDDTMLGVWHITEEESFFLEKVPLKKEISHPNKRLQHLAGRYLLQFLYADFPYHLIEIADTRKPFLPNEEYHFSISHCGHYAAAIVSKTSRVGIDIEVPTAKVKKIAYKFVNEMEQEFLTFNENNTKDTEIKILTLLWSAKEAVFKWAGNVSVDFKDHIHLSPQSFKSPDGLLNGTFLKDMDVPLRLSYKTFEPIVLVWLHTDL